MNMEEYEEKRRQMNLKIYDKNMSNEEYRKRSIETRKNIEKNREKSKILSENTLGLAMYIKEMLHDCMGKKDESLKHDDDLKTDENTQ